VLAIGYSDLRLLPPNLTYRNFKVIKRFHVTKFKKKDTTKVVNSNMFDIWYFSKTLSLCAFVPL
jgi:hypothetical protein